MTINERAAIDSAESAVEKAEAAFDAILAVVFLGKIVRTPIGKNVKDLRVTGIENGYLRLENNVTRYWKSVKEISSMEGEDHQDEVGEILKEESCI